MIRRRHARIAELSAKNGSDGPASLLARRWQRACPLGPPGPGVARIATGGARITADGHATNGPPVEGRPPIQPLAVEGGSSSRLHARQLRLIAKAGTALAIVLATRSRWGRSL